jgi:CubicO group peptidase (beta-lactamase class C family)
MSLKFLGTFCCLFIFFTAGFGQQTSPVVQTGTASIELPKTALGNIVGEWLAVVNQGDREEIRRFVETRFSANAFRNDRPADAYAAFFQNLHAQSGGIEIVKVTPPVGEMPMFLIVKSKNGGRYARISTALDKVEKEKLAGLGISKTESPYAKSLSEIHPQPLSEKEMLAAIEAKIAKRAAAGDFSGAVLIARDDKILFQKAYGFSDRDARIPNTLKTGFHLASTGKMFTGVAISQLVKAGKLSYDDTVAKLLPDYPNQEIAKKVTVHQLLVHSAGFGTFFWSPGFDAKRVFRNATEEIDVYKDEKLYLEPGSRWRYSNAGFSLLGAIIERVSEKTYLEYVRENILQPVGMSDTDTNNPGEIAANASILYLQSPSDPLGIEPYTPNREIRISHGRGFGDGFSTALDLFKFTRALRTGKLLDKEFTEKMVTGKIDEDEKGSARWGYGIRERVVNGEIVRGHSGGGRTDVQMLWNSGYTVIVQTNKVPYPATMTSNEIIAFITRQNSLKKENQSSKF